MNKLHMGIGHGIVGAIAVALAAMPAQATNWTLVHADHVIADARQPASGPATIVLRDGRIDRVAAGRLEAAQIASAPGDQVASIDLGDRYVLPGLIDAHVHLASQPRDPYWFAAVRTEADNALSAAHNAEITLKAGITTVRDLGSGPESVYAVKRAIEEGTVQGPRILASGPILSIIGGHGDEATGFRRDVGQMLNADMSRTCTGVDQCAQRVREAARAGSDVIKIAATGGVLSQQRPGIDQEFSDAELRSIVDTAHSLGLRVAAHSRWPRGGEAAARAGVDSIEHGSMADDKTIAAIKKSGSYLVPTLMAWVGVEESLAAGAFSPAVAPKARDSLAGKGRALKAAHAVGVRIAMGTDAGVYDHGRNASEIPMMVTFGGLTPREALVAATVNGADLLGLANEVGTIAPGKSADIIAVDQNPFEHPETVEKVRFVMSRGKVIVRP